MYIAGRDGGAAEKRVGAKGGMGVRDHKSLYSPTTMR